MFCAFCGGTNPDDAAYCSMCARPLHGAVKPDGTTQPESTTPAAPLTGSEPTQSFTPPYMQQPAADAPTLGASYTCAVCGYVLAPFDSTCSRCKTPRGMSVDPNATIPGDYMPREGYSGAYYGDTPVDKTGWSPANIFTIISRPVDFFARQRGQKDFTQPAAFFYLVYLVQFIAQAAVMAVNPAANSFAKMGVAVSIMFVASPLVALLAVGFEFIMAGILHLFCLLFGGKGGYVGSFRVLVYASAPSMLFGLVSSLFSLGGPIGQIIGIIPSLIGLIWTVVVAIIAVREVHNVSTGAACGAVLLPGAVCIGLFVILIIVIAGIATAAGGGFRPFSPMSIPGIL